MMYGELFLLFNIYGSVWLTVVFFIRVKEVRGGYYYGH